MSYKSYQVRKKGIGLVEVKQVILHEEGKMDDGITFSRSQDEEARTAGVIRKCTILFNQFIRGLDDMTASRRHSGFFRAVDLGEVVGCLEDLMLRACNCPGGQSGRRDGGILWTMAKPL